MVDTQLSKTLNRTRTLEGNPYTAGDSLTIDLECKSVERIIKKDTKPVPRGVSKGSWGSKDPTMKLYDFKKVTKTFRLSGIISESNWSSAKSKMVDVIAMFEDGGVFTFNWLDQTYTVNGIDIIFNHTGSVPGRIDFTIDLIEGEER